MAINPYYHEHDDLEFMQLSGGWPMWPLLPMKRRVLQENGRIDLEVGVLWSLDFMSERFCWLEGVGMYDTAKLKSLTVDDGRILTKDELQELTDAGWVVD